MDLVSSLSPSSEASSQGKSGADMKAQESKDIVVTSEDGITKIMFNRPSKRNAITLQVMLLPEHGHTFLSSISLTNTTVEFQHYSYIFCGRRLKYLA